MKESYSAWHCSITTLDKNNFNSKLNFVNIKQVTAIESIQAALKSKLVDEDGNDVTPQIVPGLRPDEMQAVEQAAGMPLPDELKQLLSFCSAINGDLLAQIDFTGRSLEFEAKEVFPYGLPIATDGFGNDWILDLTPATTKIAPIFFACHDAPVILFQSPDLATFVSELFKMYMPPFKSMIDDVHEDRLFKVWRTNPGVIEQPAAADSTDPQLRDFASALPSHFQIVDLRDARPGMGFSWGRYGPKTEVQRYGDERIFAYAKPQTKSLISKLFGRA